MGSAVLFAVLAGASAAAWTICLKLGSTRINAALGAMVITGVAFFVNSIVMLSMRARGYEIVLRPEAAWLLAMAGIAAAGVDIFGLLAYGRELRLTASLIVGGGRWIGGTTYCGMRLRSARTRSIDTARALDDRRPSARACRMPAMTRSAVPRSTRPWFCEISSMSTED